MLGSRGLVRAVSCGGSMLKPVRLMRGFSGGFHALNSVPANGFKPPVTLDRELPDPYVREKKNRIYFVAYGIGVIISCVVIFNYEKTRSPITNSVLYFLRRSTIAKAELGNGINFASSWPWINGKLNTVQGKIDIAFEVRGSKKSGTLKLKATRDSKLVPFDIEHFVLECVDDNGIPVARDLTKDPEIEFDL